ncbi:MAG: DUF1295 domain-containing protein [Myxococcales bacterium]|nr:DUF1295 domain-containing protein [Myxococcales bacterium]
MSWYTGNVTYDTVLAIALVTILPTALFSAFVAAPYGRFGWLERGGNVDPRLGWWLMELPATVVFLVVFASGSHRDSPVALVFLGVWCVHYLNRGWLFPASMRVPEGRRKSFSAVVVVSGWLVTAAHGYLNAAYFTEYGHYDVDWLTDPRFVLGMALYVTSLAGNVHADAVIRGLRPKDADEASTTYRIPHGGLYRYVSCPNYLFELTAWCGFALATWSLGAVFVLGISLANLVPRALATHAWYRRTFPDYPSERRALIPHVL